MTERVGGDRKALDIRQATVSRPLLLLQVVFMLVLVGAQGEEGGQPFGRLSRP
jgi:hypothetical protein